MVRNANDPAHRERFVIGFLSLIFSVVVWVLVCKVLFPMMDFRSRIPFGTFETFSLPLSLIPLIMGVIALYRRENKLLAIGGLVVSSLTVLWLLFMVLTDGM